MKNFQNLIASIEQVHSHLQASAANAVNQALTIRNWVIGYYIVEFEQGGDDKAKYGERLLASMADRLKHIKGLEERAFRRFRQFYLTYPYLGKAIRGSVTPELQLPENHHIEFMDGDSEIDGESAVDGLPITAKSLQVPPEKLLAKLSYTHLELLLNVDEPLKRTFYELECIKGTWSVRELKRQINSLYFERSGLSQKPELLAELVHQKTSPQAPKDIIKSIYTFEFLDIPTRTIVEESDLESALLDNLQAFIIELGDGFCLEARQKRILIGANHYFIDLVFYHRVLKCHVLIELKIGAFEHNDIGQLNTYLHYYKEEIAAENDNPPVGILMVAEKDHALVRYATAGMDENLFIQKYMIKLPSKDRLESYIANELRRLR